jgi:hypothetical protein
MFKFILGLLIVIIGMMLFIILLGVAFNETASTAETVITLVMSSAFLVLTWFGIRMLIKANKKLFALEKIDAIPTENILAKWELSGNEWANYKEKKCSPEAIKRFALLASLFASLIAGLLFSLFAIDSGINTQLLIGSISAVIIFIISYFSIRKKRNSFYGSLYNLSSGELILSREYVGFCGRISPIRVKSIRPTNFRIISENNFNTLMINTSSYGTLGSSYTIYEFPIPTEKLVEAEEIIKIMKV